MIDLSFFAGVVDWLKVLFSIYGIMLNLYIFILFLSVVFLLLKDSVGIFIAEFFFLSPNQDPLDPI